MNKYLTKLAQDSINMDVPLFIRVLEAAREGEMKSDEALHWVVTRALKKSTGDKVMGMSDYEYIVNGK